MCCTQCTTGPAESILDEFIFKSLVAPLSQSYSGMSEQDKRNLELENTGLN